MAAAEAKLVLLYLPTIFSLCVLLNYSTYTFQLSSQMRLWFICSWDSVHSTAAILDAKVLSLRARDRRLERILYCSYFEMIRTKNLKLGRSLEDTFDSVQRLLQFRVPIDLVVLSVAQTAVGIAFISEARSVLYKV